MAFNDEYISRKEALLAVTRHGCTANVVGVLYHLPYADVIPKPQWISVDERLPDENGRFLTVDKFGYEMVCYWTGRFGWLASVCNKNAITHWMPLPEPPKGE